jgi:hypothetical protein
MQVWTRAMEKRLQDRVQTVLCNRNLTKVLQRFGGEVFRRSSIFHGLDEFLSERGVRGKVCFEIGTWNGLTSVVLSQYFERVISVDIAHNHLKHEIIGHLGIQNIRCFDIKDNAEKARIARKFPFDFAYMDGNHADDTASDWDLVRPCGRVLFHEVWPFQPPVWDLVRKLPSPEVATNGEGLALWEKS